MSRTLTALFDTRADAEAAKERLKASNVDVSHVHIHDQSSDGFSSAGDYSTDENKGFWAKLKDMTLPEEDRHSYEEGVRRGGCVLTAEVDGDQADEAARILEQSSSVDLDRRIDDWRKSGWDHRPRAASAATAAGMGTAAIMHDRGVRTGLGAKDRTGVEDRNRMGGEQRIPVAEERLQVGKREVDRGHVKVRSYVVDKPVHEEVSLRDENISVDRRPVDRPLTGNEDPFRERTVEMTARGEEAVVGKQAHVREEVIVRKDAGEHVEKIDDTVRQTKVEVEDDRAKGTGQFDRERDTRKL